MTASPIQKELTRLINQKLQELQFPQKPASLYDPVRYTLLLDGKRVRPYLTLIACGLCGKKVQKAIPAAIAIELLHNFTLLHDDIMDGAETRRGEPSVFKKWDASTAILSGDAMYAWAFEQLQTYGNNSDISKEQFISINRFFLKSARIVCEGQAYDLDFEKQPNVDLDDYLHMIQGKTAALISGAMCMGGVVAAADESMLADLRNIGLLIGTAFQIQDDLLDAIADPSKFGKKKGGDIIEGKKTYLSISAMEKGNPTQQKQLKSVLKSENVSQQDVDEIIKLYNTLGIIDQARQEIDKKYKESLSLLENFDNSPYKEDLKHFISELINRQY